LFLSGKICSVETMEADAMETPHLETAIVSQQDTSQQTDDVSIPAAAASSATNMTGATTAMSACVIQTSGTAAPTAPVGEPELPPLRNILYQSEEDLHLLRQQQAERAAGMQLRWMQGNAVAAPFFPAFDAPSAHPPTQWMPPPLWPLLNQQQQWGPVGLHCTGYAAAPPQHELVEQLLQQELEQQHRLEHEVAQQRAWAQFTAAASAPQQTLISAATAFAPAGAQLQQLGGLWLGNDTQLLSRPLPPCVTNSFDSITTTRRSYNEKDGPGDSNSTNFYGGGPSYAALDAFTDAAMASAAAAASAAVTSSSSSYAPMDVSTVPGFGWSDSGIACGSHEYTSSGSSDEGDGDNAVVWTMRGAQQRQQQQQQQVPTDRPVVHRVSSSTSSGSSPQQHIGKTLRRSSECLLTAAGAAAAAAQSQQSQSQQPTRRRSSNTGMRRKAVTAAASGAAALRRHSAPASDAAAAAASGAVGNEDTGASTVRRSSRLMPRFLPTVKSEDWESEPTVASAAASIASAKAKAKSRAVKDELLLSLSPLTMGTLPPRSSSSDATTAAAAAAAGGAADSSSAAAGRVAKESLRYGPVYDMRNARYQRSLHTTRSWLLDEIFDYHTSGVFPVRLNDRPDSSSRRRDFKSAASR
jgi:hypothetical protein